MTRGSISYWDTVLRTEYIRAYGSEWAQENVTLYQRSGPGRRLQIWCADSPLDAADVYWSWVGEMNAGISEEAASRITRPRNPPDWCRLSQQRAGWGLTTGVPRVSDFHVCCRTILHHLRILVGDDNLVPGVTRPQILSAQCNLSNADHYGADGFWTCIWWLALHGQVTGSVQRYQDAIDPEPEWLERVADMLLEEEYITASDHDYLLGTHMKKYRHPLPSAELP